MNFEVTKDQEEKIDKWLKEKIYPKAIKKQKKQLKKRKQLPTHVHISSWEMGYPASSVQYIFTPTGIGTCLVVKESVTGEELDVTDYDTW